MSKNKKIALALAGGGVAGIEFEIGALMAMWDLGMTVENLDFITGISAGSILAALIANGVTPHEINESLHGRADEYNFPFRTLYKLNYEGFGRRLMKVTPRVNGIVKRAVNDGLSRFKRRNKKNLLKHAIGSTLDSVLDLGSAGIDIVNALTVPPFNMSGLEKYFRERLNQPTGLDDRVVSDSFDELKTDLVITATDANNKCRVLMGPQRLECKMQRANADYFVSKDVYLLDVPISRAIAASSSIPGLYGLTDVQGRKLFDGEVYDTANVDLAITLANADLVMVVNPLKPRIGGNIEQWGLVDQLQQSLRMMIEMPVKKYLKYLKIHGKHLPAPWNKHRDIILIEPEDCEEDPVMFHYFLMRSKEKAVKLGYGRVMEDVDRRRDYHARMADECGVDL
ncbi:hypothetical protein COT47_02360, partial [Candidatus Woesearchaeota archaeon CG08_land_8_20_14_0_20_43_7]